MCFLKNKTWYLRISSHTAVQSGIVPSYSVGVNQRLSKHGRLCEIKVFIHWIFIDFTLKTSIRNIQIGLRIYYSWHTQLRIKISLNLEKHKNMSEHHMAFILKGTNVQSITHGTESQSGCLKLRQILKII